MNDCSDSIWYLLRGDSPDETFPSLDAKVDAGFLGGRGKAMAHRNYQALVTWPFTTKPSTKADAENG
jgi:hypothetical protein